jgi:hypothetical protein
MTEAQAERLGEVADEVCNVFAKHDLTMDDGYSVLLDVLLEALLQRGASEEEAMDDLHYNAKKFLAARRSTKSEAPGGGYLRGPVTETE